MASKRGEATREHILDVAEQLWGERGVSNVSLREIRLAAGARNTAAVHFHFGDRDGLLDALIDRHVSRIGDRQRDLWEAIVADAQTDDPRRLVELLVRPCAEYLTLGPSERAWVKIMAHLAAAPDIRLNVMVAIAPTQGVGAGRALHEQMARVLPDSIARERMFVCARMAVNVCADRARLVDSLRGKRNRLSDEVFVENLIDMVLGALTAPARLELPKPTPGQVRRATAREAGG